MFAGHVCWAIEQDVDRVYIDHHIIDAQEKLMLPIVPQNMPESLHFQQETCLSLALCRNPKAKTFAKY